MSKALTEEREYLQGGLLEETESLVAHAQVFQEQHLQGLIMSQRAQGVVLHQDAAGDVQAFEGFAEIQNQLGERSASQLRAAPGRERGQLQFNGAIEKVLDENVGYRVGIVAEVQFLELLEALDSFEKHVLVDLAGVSQRQIPK